MKKIKILLFCLWTVTLNAQVTPLPNAHAHNDYEHDRPLFDALDHGFTSVEVDVHLIEGELYVTHNRPKALRSDLTLAELYLKPLQKRIQANGGRVYTAYEDPFYLMIDIKTDAEATYKVLRQQLGAYQSLFRLYKGETILEDGPCVLFLSGNRPIEMIRAEKQSYIALDGRPEDLGKGFSSEMMPVISQRYGKILKWRGQGKIPRKQWKRLKQLAKDAEKEGKKLRLWASPEDPLVWETLLKAGADLINTDELEQLKSFMKNRKG